MTAAGSRILVNLNMTIYVNNTSTILIFNLIVGISNMAIFVENTSTILIFNLIVEISVV